MLSAAKGRPVSLADATALAVAIKEGLAGQGGETSTAEVVFVLEQLPPSSTRSRTCAFASACVGRRRQGLGDLQAELGRLSKVPSSVRRPGQALPARPGRGNGGTGRLRPPRPGPSSSDCGSRSGRSNNARPADQAWGERQAEFIERRRRQQRSEQSGATSAQNHRCAGAGKRFGGLSTALRTPASGSTATPMAVRARRSARRGGPGSNVAPRRRTGPCRQGSRGRTAHRCG